MNLIDEEENEKKLQNTKIIKIIGITLIVLIIIVIGLIAFLSYEKSKQFKYLLNGYKQEISSDLFYFEENGDVYISIKDLSNILSNNSIKCEYNNGKYKQYDENKRECNIEQEYEVTGYEDNSNEMYKVLLEDGSYEYFTLDKPVKYLNNKLYTTQKGIEIGFNIAMNYDEKNNAINMYTLDNLVENYAKRLNNTVINSKEMSFSNKKVVKYDMIIVSNENKEYGVQKISTKEMILGTKYKDLKFLESSQDFIVTTPEGKQGIIAASKGKDIKPQYAEIKKLKEDLNLYLIKNDKNKYGVYNREKQEAIIYPEYDSIGVEIDKFKNENIENQYVLYDNCIPCKKSDNGIYKWELIDINGKKLVDQQFDSIGYIKGTSKNLKGDNLLLIPELESIIVCKDSMYNIVTSTGKILLPNYVQQVYSETSEGKNTYYMVYNNKTFNVLETIKNSNSSTSTNKGENNESKQNSNTTKNSSTSNNSTTTNNTVNNSNSSNSSNSVKTTNTSNSTKAAESKSNT